MDVAIYLRKSRAEEHEDTHETLQRHRNILMEYIHTHRLALLETYDEVVSGESLYARPKMLELLEQVESGRYDAVLCMDIDRLGRGGMREQGIILDTFKYSDTKIITPEKTYDLTDDLDEELTEFKTFMSRREYKLITKRLRRGLHQVIQSGCYVSNAPFGYRSVYVDKKPTLEIVEDEAHFVRMIFNMYCDGIGCSTVASTINALGATPRRSNSFGRTSIMHILRNPTFTGKVVWNRKKHIRKGVQGNTKHIAIYQPPEEWMIVDGLHPPIISIEQFEKAQQIARSRYIPPSNNGTIKSPLAGLIRCKNCGKNMQRMSMHQGVAYLLCNTKNCCAGAKYDFVENALLQALRVKLDELQVELDSTNKENDTAQDHILAGIQNEQKKTLAQKEKLHTLLEQGTYDVDTYRERMAIVTKKIAELDKKETSMRGVIAKATLENKERLAVEIQSVLNAYEASGAEQKNKMLKSIIEHVGYTKKKKTKPMDFQIEIELRTAIS